MKNLFLAFWVYVLSIFSFAQIENEDYTQASPIIGWDSLRSIIERPENYPEILRRAGVAGNIYLSLLIDSTGNLLKLEPAYSYLSKVDSFNYKYLIPVVEKMLDSVKWKPSYKNFEPINDKIYRYFSFILINDKDRGFNILAPYFFIKKTH